MNLFVSYRRIDAHPAQRLRACLSEAFGEDAVFIDREIEPGSDWRHTLSERLGSCDGIVVLVGDDFLRELQRRADRPATESEDWMAREIEIALKLDKRIYPVLIGTLDMPEAAQLPNQLRDFAAKQAVFAREPFFDAAMAALVKSVAAQLGWVDRRPGKSAAGSGVGAWAGRATAAVLLVAAGVGAVALAGRLVLWNADPARDASLEATLWHGLLYTLATLAWGLGPYLAWRAVSEIRARARLPVANKLGLLTTVNLALALALGGSFLLLSTRADWQLLLLGLMPPLPAWWQYALQGGVLVAIVFAPVAAALLEPHARKFEGAQRVRRVAVIGALNLGGAFGLLYIGVSMWETLLPQVRPMNPVPLVGYFMLTPALSALLFVWDHARTRLGFDSRSWHNRTLVGLAVGLHLACTLAYFAHGPVHLLRGGA